MAGKDCLSLKKTINFRLQVRYPWKWDLREFGYRLHALYTAVAQFLKRECWQVYGALFSTQIK